MSMKYYKLFDLLVRKGMKKTDLLNNKIISSPTLAKLSKGETVTTRTLNNICKALDCQPGDIMEYVPSDQADKIIISETQPAAATCAALEPNHTISSKSEKYYRPFTEAEASNVDLHELQTNIRYQLDIALTFGENVLTALLEKASQQTNSANVDYSQKEDKTKKENQETIKKEKNKLKKSNSQESK